jgi:hypothetical protein
MVFLPPCEYSGEMAWRRAILWTGAVALLGLSGCRPSHHQWQQQFAPASGQEPPWLILRVDTVRVSPTRPGTTQTWDGPAPTPSDGAECGLLGIAVGLIYPVAAKGAALLCKVASRPEHQERDPSAPDLAVLLTAGAGMAYETQTAKDATYAVFRREFVVPTGAIPPDGLALDVIDRDGASFDVIGSVRAFRRDLVSVALSQRPLMVLRDPRGGLEEMQIVVTPYAPPQPEVVQASMDAQEGTLELPFRAVRAGEVIEIRASGRYQVGNWNDEVIDPRGYPGGKLKQYNFKPQPFTDAPHGSGLAIVAAGARQGIVVAPCATSVARVSGPLLVGVNDEDPKNNRGPLQFSVTVRPAIPEEWVVQQAAGCSGW